MKKYSDATEAERLEMLKQAIEEAALPEGLDLRSLAKEAVETYWSEDSSGATAAPPKSGRPWISRWGRRRK